MRIVYNGADEGLRAASDFVNSLTDNDEFWRQITDHGTFRDSSVASDRIAEALRACDSAVRVVHWRPRMRPRTVAVTDPGRRFEILYNMRNFGANSTASKVHTVMHEFVHNVDFFADGDGRIEYSHATSPYSDSAPYWIGDLARRFYLETQPKAADTDAPVDPDLYADDTIPIDPAEVEE